MSELDKKKAELAFWEKLFFAGLAALFGLAGWFSAHYKSADEGFFYAELIAFLLVMVAVLFSYRRIRITIDELGEL